MTTKIDWDQFRDLFPVLGGITERQVLRIEALRKLKQRATAEEDEATQARKLAKERLEALVKLEEWL